uniref:Uncharacterized protein n=1 Tax=Candidatus Kentrum sp. LPFa TaxID=2126335 RepID=A0A450WK81_9GAMM|nr:MAG: hypothetical protein BECKLPF1236B_GA0070989_111710 [Candidatus Kentron sp. LPFa]
MAEVTHTGLDRLAEMEMADLLFWCEETRRYLSAKAEAMRAEFEGR